MKGNKDWSRGRALAFKEMLADLKSLKEGIVCEPKLNDYDAYDDGDL